MWLVSETEISKLISLLLFQQLDILKLNKQFPLLPIAPDLMLGKKLFQNTESIVGVGVEVKNTDKKE